MIKNIVFDMGNVLMYFEPRRFLESLGISDERKNLLLEHLFYAKEWKDLDEGTKTEEEVDEILKSKLSEEDYTHAQHLLYHWHDEIQEVEGMAELLKDLKEKGFNLYLLSNAGLSHDRYWKRLKASVYFDGIMISAKEKLIKPDEKLYRRLLERFNLKPEECLFIDDLQDNVKSAKKVGMEGLVFSGDVKALREALPLKL